MVDLVNRPESLKPPMGKRMYGPYSAHSYLYAAPVKLSERQGFPAIDKYTNT